MDADHKSGDKAGGAWKQIWSAGQGVGAIDNIPSTAKLVAKLKQEYQEAAFALK